ncbi:MAG: protein kinase [Planctomycetes bacterium]|nr:protein kinase [Planctomycetota bacterium]
MVAKPGAGYLREIDPICDRFEAAVREGSDPRIDDYLGLVREEARPALLAHLLELQLDYENRNRDSKRGAEAHAASAPAEPSSGVAATSAPQPLLPERREGTRFGAFVLSRELGRGGMGVVYEARQPELDRTVALKLISPALISSEEHLRRFRREARAAARLHHSHIVQLYEFGQQNAVPYMALQLVVGEPLSKRIEELSRREPSAPASHAECRAIARVGFEIASALAYAHARGVLHRDVKPGNILIDESGTAYLSDFGLARIEDDERSLSSGILGTLRYMAPECFRGSGDASADLYALGATLYDWAARLRPSEPRERKTRTGGERVPPLRERRAGVPRDFDTIVLRAMELDPRQRFTTAAELAADLEAFLADRPIHSRRPSVLERWWRWQRRNPVLGAITSALVLCVLALAIGATIAAEIFRRQGAELEQRATREATLHFDLRSRALELARQLDRAELQAAFRAHEDTGSFAELQHLVEQRERNMDLGPPQSWEWDFLRSAARDVARGFPGADASLDQISVQPGGKWIAAGGGRVQFFDREEERWDPARAVDIKCAQLSWRADGRFLGLVSWGAHFLDASTWQISARFEEPDVAGLALHPTQDVAAIAMHSGELVLFSWRTSEVLWRAPSMLRTLCRFSFSPDGSRLAFEDREGQARVLELADRSSRSFSRGASRWVQALAWHPAGRMLAMAAEKRLRIFDVERGEMVAEVDLQGREPLELDFDAEGRKLALTCNGGTILVWEVETLLASSAMLDAPPKRVLRGIDGNTTGARIDPSGARVYASSSRGVLHLWDLGSPPSFRQYGRRTRPGPYRSLGLAWQPQLEQLWVSTREGVQRWSSDGTLQGATIARASIPAPSSDGRVLAFASDQHVELVEVDSGASLGEIPMASLQLAWHPNAPHLVTVGDYELGLWDTAGPTRCLRTWRTEERCGPVSFAPDGLALWQLIGGELVERGLSTDASEPERKAHFTVPAELLGASALGIRSQDGVIALGTQSGAIQLFDLRVRAFTERLSGHGTQVTDLAWSPDGTRLASVAHDRTLRLWDVDGGALLLTLQAAEALMKVRWSTNGDALAALSEQGRILVWDASLARNAGGKR